MVMVTRSSYRKACESLSSSDISEKNIIPPWCSSRKVYERKPRKVTSASPTWEIRSSYPLRENIWEYLYENNNVRNFNCNKRKVHCKLKHKNRCGKTTVILIVFLFVFITLLCKYELTSRAGINYEKKKTQRQSHSFSLDPTRELMNFKAIEDLPERPSAENFFDSLWISNSIPKAALIAKVIPKAKLISFFGLEQTSVSQECCDKMKYLATQLARAEELLRNTLRLRRVMMLPSSRAVTDATVIDRQYIDGATATKGTATEEWGGRVALWGVVPLWRAAHPLDTILALRKPTPSDCWPLSGSEGEIIIGLPQIKRVKYISVEHVRPDTAMSAPKLFTIYGILGNDTWIKITDGHYHHRGTAKQYYRLKNWNCPVKGIVFSVRSNHGNPKYTCIYRVHVYESISKDLDLF